MVIIYTHWEHDFDAELGITILKHFGKKRIPGIEKAEIVYGPRKVTLILPHEISIFVDVSPQNVPQNLVGNIIVFDHHPHEDYSWKQENGKPWEKRHTATSLIVEFLGLSPEDPQIQEIIKAAYRSDFGNDQIKMNIADVLREMHLIGRSEEETLCWSLVVTKSFFEKNDLTTEDLQAGTNFFKQDVEAFLRKSENSKANSIFQEWLTKQNISDDKMNIVFQTAFVLKSLGQQKTHEWLSKAIDSIEEGQRLIQQAQSEFESADKVYVDGKVIIFAITNNRKFSQYWRSKKAEDKNSLLRKRTVIIVQFRTDNEGFIISTNGPAYKLSDVIKALRIRILQIRNKWVFLPWRALQAEGVLEGTEPLYYRNNWYGIIEFNHSSRPVGISLEELKQIISIAVDEDYFPEICHRNKECGRRNCKLYPWQMWRCYKRRSQASN